MRNISRWNLLGGLLVAALLVVLLAFFIDWEDVYSQARQANWFYLGLASVPLVIGYVSYAWRWRLLLEYKPDFQPVFHATNVGNLVNAFIPARAGEPARIVMLSAQQDLSIARVTSSFFVERWLEQLMRLTALGFAVAYGAGLAVSTPAILVLVAVLAVAYFLMVWILKSRSLIQERFPRWLSRLPRLSEASARGAVVNLIDGLEVLGTPRRFALALTWSLVTWGLFWAFHYLVLLALPLVIQPGMLLALSIGSLALAPPSATTLPGLYHASIIVPLSLLVFNREALTTYVVLMNAVLMFWVVLLGLLGLGQVGFSLHFLSPAHKQLPESWNK